MMYKVIIVDDEPHARRYLSELIQKDEELDLIESFGNGHDALDFLDKENIDIVFLDIEMPGINGIDLLGKLAPNHKAEIIFTTAYNQYAVTAFEAQALDYLLKPFDEERFSLAVERAKVQLDLKSRDQLHKQISDLYEGFKTNRSPQVNQFVIKEKGLEFTVKTNNIIVIEADGVYAVLVTKNKKHLYRVALNDLDATLPSCFLRIHRSYIINTEQLVKLRYLNNSTFSFEMTNGSKYTSGRSYQDKIKEMFNEKGA